MGLFDWLFGKKKDPYGGTFHENQDKSSSDQPATRNYVTPSPSTNVARPPAKRRRPRELSYRNMRSNQPVDPVEGQSLTVARPLSHLGGTRQAPDPHTDVAGLRNSGLPEIGHLDDLAELLGITRNEVVFLASRPRWNKPGHYTLKELRKKSGATRLLMVPMPRLKAAQRALNTKLVSKLPVHECAHGFCKGRDVLSGASPHVGKDIVVSLDIEDFFPSFTFRRVSGYLRSLGYGRGVAVALANLTTERLQHARVKQGSKWQPVKYSSHPELSKRYHPELPQGAPTSPGIANAIVRRMDKRLHALALKFGADYTRYADDLTFSGNLELAAKVGNLLSLVRQIVRTEGLRLNESKTRVMRRGRQQRVTGVVVNKQTNVSRRDYDRLKAILHNCVKHGPAGQNRDAVPDFAGHLRGRIAHVSHIGPERGRKLMRMFEQIRW